MLSALLAGIGAKAFMIGAISARRRGGGGGGAATVTYDTRMGVSVDANGYANLPLRAGAKRFYVNPATGNDSRTATQAQDPATPLASAAAARALVTQGAGDQICLVQGGVFNEGIPNLTGKDGFGPQYPTVIQSYDPADPANEAKMGRAFGAARPKFTQIGTWLAGGPGVSPKYVALRDCIVDAGNVSSNVLNILPSGTGVPEYVLLENNVFRYMMLNTDMLSSAAGEGACFIFRNNSIYGGWDVSAHAQGIYLDYWSSYTIEDNVFYHNGWKIGASRDDDATIGGPTQFRHPIYAQDTTTGVIRRNLILDGAADGGSPRGDVVYTENVVIDCPIGVGAGGGLHYDTARPAGVDVEVSYNAFLGDADLNSAAPRGTGMTTMNGKPGSKTFSNLWARSRAAGSSNITMETDANFAMPSYMDYFNNVSFAWAPPGQQTVNGGNVPAQCISSWESNYWEAATSGANFNVSALSMPTAYTAAQLYTALGYADKAAFVAYVIEHPEARLQRAARALLFTGYAVPLGLGSLSLSTASLQAGVPATGRINGALKSSTISATGLPAGLTINGASHTWSWDGSGAISSGTIVLTETPGTGAPKATNVAFAIVAPTAKLDPANMSTGVALSADKLTATMTGNGPFGVRADKAITGPAYWEAKAALYVDGLRYGVIDASASFTAGWWGSSGHAVAFSPNGNNDTEMFFVESGLIWHGRNGAWLNGDPTATPRTGGTALSGMSGSIWPAIQGDAGDKGTFNFGASPYTYTPPHGAGNV